MGARITDRSRRRVASCGQVAGAVTSSVGEFMATSNRDIAQFVPGFDLRAPSSHHLEIGARPTSRRLVDHFDEEFYCVSADEFSAREDAYHVRYLAYCVENHFEDAGENLDGQEMDEFDSHAPHKLLLHRSSGRAAGVVRLILPEPALPDHGLPFNSLIGPWGPVGRITPPQRTAEVSRFAVVRQVRDAIRKAAGPRITEDQLPTGAGLMKNISIGLMRGVVEIAAEHGISHLCAVMEPALLRLLARLGVHFQPLGPIVHYHGVRQPCFADLDRLLARTWAERRDVWEILTGEGVTWPLGRRSAFTVADALQ